jgi:hypothetical protein
LELAHAKRLRPFHLEMMVKRTWDSKAIGPWPQAVVQTLGVSRRGLPSSIRRIA